MRSVLISLALAASAVAGAGCERTKPPRPAAAAARRPAPSPAPGDVDPPTAASPSPAPASTAIRFDCDRLLGAERASQALGRRVLVSSVAPPEGECQYLGRDGDAMVHVTVGCGEQAMPIAHSVTRRLQSGGRAVAVGQQGVLVASDKQGIVQFLQRHAPCAVEVTAVPAGRVIDVARAVALGLGEAAPL